MRQLYYTLVATIVWLSFVFNLEWLVGSPVLAPFMYVLIPTCVVLAILVLGRYRVSLVWLLAFGVAAYAALEIQFALTHAGESVSAVVTGLAAVVVTILLSGLLGRRLAQLQRLLTNLMVGQPDSQGGGDERLFENAQSVLYREVRRARRYHHALAVLDVQGQSADIVRATEDGWRIDGCPHHGPTLVAAQEGFHAVWFGIRQEGDATVAGVRYARLATDGRPEPGSVQRIPDARAEHADLQVIGLPAGILDECPMPPR